jgi:hypothetical protein
VEDIFGFVIREFMFELHELESKNGMLLDVADLADFRIRETLVSVCADTKGAHEIGGFMSLSAKKFCRLCLIEHPEINFKRRIDDLVLRDRNNYDEAVVASNSDVNEIPKTGVKFSSLLNESKFFHFAENLILDCMHDLLEGVAPFSITNVNRAFATISPEFGIDAELLNSRINTFQFSFYDPGNKPSSKFSDEKIRQKGNYSTKQRAGQNFCLLNMYPLLIGDKVPEGNFYFAIILTLRHIMDIVFSPIITIEQTVILEMLVARYFEQFRFAFPDVQGINKMHHMVHYAQIIRSQM